MNATPLPPNADVAPEALRAALDAGTPLVLLDVREAHERAISRLPGADVHIPLGELPRRAAAELDPDAEIVVYCRTGNRSAVAARALRAGGFANVRNLLGGVNAWSERVDPAVRRY